MDQKITVVGEEGQKKKVAISEEQLDARWKNLKITNDFLFGKVMQNPELCRGLLQRIFPKLQIDRVEYPELQKEIKEDVAAKGVRLDVYVKGNNGVVYNIEMQVDDTKELPKRSRYYQGMMDLQLLDSGEYYKKLNQSYVIFICTFDLFGKGRHIYTFENICQEDKSVRLGDGAAKIFLNANSEMNDVSEELRAFLDYVKGQKTDDPYVRMVDEALEEAKQNREWRREYMTLMMRDIENVERGREEGREEERRNILTLFIQNRRKKGESDIVILDDLCKQLGLPEEYVAQIMRQV